MPLTAIPVSEIARRRLLQMHFESEVGHIGGNLSFLDILLAAHHWRPASIEQPWYALRTSDLGESKLLFTQALKYAPMNVEAIGNLANFEAKEGNFSRGLELLGQAMQINSNEP